MLEFYKSKLDPRYYSVYDKVVCAFQEKETRVLVDTCGNRKYKQKELNDILDAAYYDHPELFYWRGSGTYRCGENNGWYYYPNYSLNRNEIFEKEKKCQEVIDRISTAINNTEGAGIYGKCLWIYDWMVGHCIYDDDAFKHSGIYPEAYTYVGVFLKNKAVCAGFAKAYQILCEACGMDCIYVHGNSLNPIDGKYGNHAWNMVRAGEEGVLLDVTWDICCSRQRGFISHDYFFLSTTDMDRDHTQQGYPYCGRGDLNYFVQEGMQFSDKEEIRAYIRRVYDQMIKKGDDEGKIYFRTEWNAFSEDDVREIIKDVLKKSKWSSFSIGRKEKQPIFHGCIKK